MEIGGGGDSEGIGTSTRANVTLGPMKGRIVPIPMNAVCGVGSSGAADAGAHVEQQIEV